MNNFIHNSIYQHNWIVPRSVMCTLFWTGVILVFTGMILLVTRKHKSQMYESWGGVLLGLGLCVLLVCLILCIHAYCVMAAGEEENAAPKPDSDGTTDHYAVGTTSLSGGYQQPLDKDGLFPDASMVNGRKPRSAGNLVPPPKFGVNVTKPPVHTVRFFLTDEGGVGTAEEEESGSVTMDETKTRARPGDVANDSDRQQKTQSKGASDATLGVDGSIVPPTTNRYYYGSDLEIDLTAGTNQTNTSPVDPRMASDVRSLDRAVMSSDCDSMMSIETIIPRTLQQNPADERGGQRRLSTYDVPDDGHRTADSTSPPIGIADPSQDPDESHSSGGSVKITTKPFPAPGSATAVEKGGKTKRLSGPPPASTTTRHSQRKLQQQQQTRRVQRHNSSETSPSPGSPESPLLEHPVVDADLAAQTAAPAAIDPRSPAKPPPAARSTAIRSPSHHHHHPTQQTQPMLGGLSITRTFGPSTVTVTPLGTQDSLIHHRRYPENSDEKPDAIYHRRLHQTDFRKAPRSMEEGDYDDELEFLSTKRDLGGGWRASDKSRQPAVNPETDRWTSDRQNTTISRLPSNPALLEITESKATVYDNVQYFQM